MLVAELSSDTLWPPQLVCPALLRAYQAVLVRCTYLCVSAAFIAYLLVRNNSVSGFSPRAALAEALFVPLTSIALASCAGPLLRTERRATWVLASESVSPARQRLAVALALAVVAGSLALPYCAVLAFGLDLVMAEWVHLIAEHLLLGSSFAVMAEGVARRALHDRGRDSTRVLPAASSGSSTDACVAKHAHDIEG